MPLTFNGTTIPGSFLLSGRGAPDYQRQENEVFGAVGTTLLTGQLTKRPLVFDAMIYSTDGTFNHLTALEAFLITLNGLAGTVDQLVESNDAIGSRTFGNCEFQKFEESPRGVLPPGGTITSWWVAGKLTFLQLIPDS
jgi:hypothetical protein